MPRTIQIHANEITDAITEPLKRSSGAVRAVLEETLPELSSDIDGALILTEAVARSCATCRIC
ncbi:MAG: rod shape-determining protein [Thermomicrobiales bacterium]